jgi:hypothetical protein
VTTKYAGRRYPEYGDATQVAKSYNPVASVSAGLSYYIATAQTPAYVSAMINPQSVISPWLSALADRVATKQPAKLILPQVDNLLRASYGLESEHKRNPEKPDENTTVGYLVYRCFMDLSSEPHRVHALDRFLGQALWPYVDHVTDVGLTSRFVTQHYLLPGASLRPVGDFAAGLMIPVLGTNMNSNFAKAVLAAISPNLTMGLLPAYAHYRPDQHSGHEGQDVPAGRQAASRDILRRFVGVAIAAWSQHRVVESRARVRWAQLMHELHLHCTNHVSLDSAVRARMTGFTGYTIDYNGESERLLYAIEALAQLPYFPAFTATEPPAMEVAVTNGHNAVPEFTVPFDTAAVWPKLREAERNRLFGGLTADEDTIVDIVAQYRQYLASTAAKLPAIEALPGFAQLNAPPVVPEEIGAGSGYDANQISAEEAAYLRLREAGLIRQLAPSRTFMDPRVMWEIQSTACGEMITGSKGTANAGDLGVPILTDVMSRVGWSREKVPMAKGGAYDLHDVPIAVTDGEAYSVSTAYIGAGLIPVMHWAGPEHGYQDVEPVQRPHATLVSRTRAILSFEVTPRGLLPGAHFTTYLLPAAADTGLAGVELGMLGAGDADRAILEFYAL